MEYEISYVQSRHERYDTDMNDRVRQLLEAYDIRILEEFGGSSLTGEENDLVADEAFVVETDAGTLERVSGLLRDIVTRDVAINEVTA